MLGSWTCPYPPRGGGARAPPGGYHCPRPIRRACPGRRTRSTVAVPTVPKPIAAADDLLLKVTAPRVPRHLLTRERLQSDQDQLRDKSVIVIQAPPGFGKTSLLAQWRREHLARGGIVAWMTAQGNDDGQRLVQALALAVRIGAGRPGFGATLVEAAGAAGFEGVTMWLAEVAQTALDIVLIVDEADRLQPAARDALAYLLHNTPPNLRVVVAARTDCRLGIDDLLAYGQSLGIGTEELRLRQEETMALVQARFGTRVDRDAAARLYEITEGWALGLQLALSVMSSAADPQAELEAMSGRRDALNGLLVNLMLANLPQGDLALLTRVAMLDLLHPALCNAVMGSEAAAERLARLVRDTPVFVAGEASEWMRMHALARDELRRRFALLPETEQAQLHSRASAWLAEHGMVEASARHALACGENDRAYDLAERSLYESLMSRGRHRAVLDWLARLPAAELERRPRLLLAAAWTLALSEHHEEARRYVERILAAPGVDDARRCECALILSGAAVYADDPDRFVALHDPWADAPPLADPTLRQLQANRAAYRTLIDGEPALARLRRQQAQQGDAGPGLEYVSRWCEFGFAQSYLWEGQYARVDRVLRPLLARAETELGRRSSFTCMVASLLATAMWERDEPAQAAATLANRLDVLERSGLPDTVVQAYRTMARMSAAEGAEDRALELLGSLDAVGLARRLPRLRIVSLADQVRLHAHRFRTETCADLCQRIDAILASADAPPGPLWRRGVSLTRDVALGHAELAARRWRQAAEIWSAAAVRAQALKLGRLHVELLGLRAYALDHCGERSLPLLEEAVGLARAYGLRRVFADAHPGLGDWVREALPEAAAGGGALAAPIQAPRPAPDSARPHVTPSLALTPKEREVMELLARNLSNKEIGLAMQVGEETIKWHMKNLFTKLDAGTRKQVVQRARILGLIDTPM
ncbi:MAG: AAA family ATPase [Burkholderiales bacterium]|nr:AAA family ATPase [Burkholderiales bacterium]